MAEQYRTCNENPGKVEIQGICFQDTYSKYVTETELVANIMLSILCFVA